MDFRPSWNAPADQALLERRSALGEGRRQIGSCFGEGGESRSLGFGLVFGERGDEPPLNERNRILRCGLSPPADVTSKPFRVDQGVEL